MKNLWVLFICVIVSSSWLSGNAYSYCAEPSMPQGTVPVTPFCITFKNCTQEELDVLKSDVENYIKNMDFYLEQTREYVNCKKTNVIKMWNDVAKEY